jgi:surface polysaccharide O-acyltransferase-like enzyme
VRRLGLDALRIISILGVISIHTFGGIVTNDAVRGSGSWWLANALDIGFIWVVPVFVMVSGALVLAPRMHQDGPGAFYRKRLLRLGWAFVFWQVFYVVVVYMGLSGAPLSWRQAAGLVYDGTTYTHLYFLWLIVGLYAVAPILYAFLRDGGQRRAGLLALGLIAATTLVYVGASVLSHFGTPRSVPLMALTQWIPYAGYFAAGWALRELRLRGWRLLAGAVATIAAIVSATLLYALPDRAPLLHALLPVNYLGPLVVLSAVGVFVVGNSVFDALQPRLPARASRAVAVVSDAVFGVYLFHFFLLVLAQRLWPELAVRRAETWWVAAVLAAAIAVVSFAVSMAMRRVPFVRRLF